MDDEKRAQEAIRKLAMAKLNPYKKQLEAKVKDEVGDFSEEELGIDRENMERALLLAKIAADQRLKMKHNFTDDTNITGEVDLKNKSWKVGLNHSF